MELRTLRYLQAVAQEGNVSNAAKSLHMTQPTLSRQLSALEDEFGCELFTRTYRGMSLNDRGVMLLRYAESMLDLADKAREELSAQDVSASGSVYIGAGETLNMAIVADAMSLTCERYPKVVFQLSSGATTDLIDGFARGAYDFLIECELREHADMNVLELPIRDRWGVLTRKDSHLAKLEAIRPEDLKGQQVIVPRQALANGTLAKWAGPAIQDLQVSAEFNLPLNASILARGGMGCQLTYEDLFETSDDTELVFVPLSPELTSRQGIIWRKTSLSNQASAFLDCLKEVLAARAHS